MQPDQVRALEGFLKRLSTIAGASTGGWPVAKRVTYIVLLGVSLLIFYLLWSLEQALDMVAR